MSLLVLLTRADSDGVLSNTNLFEEATLSHIILPGPKAAGTKRMRVRSKEEIFLPSAAEPRSVPTYSEEEEDKYGVQSVLNRRLRGPGAPPKLAVGSNQSRCSDNDLQ